MKKSTKILIGASAVAAGMGYAYISAQKQVKNLPEGFTVTAHTGCEGKKDNSLEAIIAGKNAGADIVEFDLRFDSSGNGILSHDEGAENPVSLEEAFSVISTCKGLKVNVDAKTTDNLKEVYRMSEKFGITDRIFYTGIEEKDVEAVKTQTPGLSYYLNYAVDSLKNSDRDYISSLISLVKEKGAVGLNVKYTRCSKLMVEMFRQEGLYVSLWTANDIVSMLRCISLTPDNITTRHPATLKKLIKMLSK